MKPLFIKLEDDLADWLDKIVKEKGTSKKHYITELLESKKNGLA